MGKGVCTFKEADLTRAVKAARKAGLEIAGVRVAKDGTIEIVAGKPGEVNGRTGEGATTGEGEWDNIQ